MKKKNSKKIFLIVSVIAVIFLLGYFGGFFNTILRQSYENTQIQFTSYRIHTSNYTNELDKFLITATIKEVAKSSKEKLKPGDEFGIMISDFQPISKYKDRNFDNEILIQYANAGLTQKQALQICQERLPTVTECKNEYVSTESREAGYKAQECYCQAPGLGTAIYLLDNYDIDPTSTLTISRSQYMWKHEYNLVNCKKVVNEIYNKSRCITNPTLKGCTWSGIKCDNNIKIISSGSGTRGYITISGITPSDIPMPIEQPTSVNVKLILKKPGTYVYTEPYIKQDHMGCYGNDVYWFDSKGIVNSLIKACPSSQQCINSTCAIKVYDCIENSDVLCYKNGLYYVDSCGQMGELKTQCDDTQVCLSNTKICKDKEEVNIVVNPQTTISTQTNQTSDTQTPGIGGQPISDYDIKSNIIYYIIAGVFLLIIGIILFIKFKKR